MGEVSWGAPQPIVDLLCDTLALRTCVETGTFRGDSAAAFAGRFDRVITIEASPTLAAAACRRLAPFPNVDARHGDSRQVLPEVVAGLEEPALFWLDGHYCGQGTHGVTGQCPVLEEIATIVAAAPAHVLLIDDARLFLEPPPLPLHAVDWPAIDEICRAVAAGDRRRFITVHDDVIVAVPEEAREAVTRWLVDRATAREAERHRGMIASALRIIRRQFGRGTSGERP
jgi:hypothetical protein